MTQLGVATANDFELAELVQPRTRQMMTPDLRTLVTQAGDILGQWGATLLVFNDSDPRNRLRPRRSRGIDMVKRKFLFQASFHPHSVKSSYVGHFRARTSS